MNYVITDFKGDKRLVEKSKAFYTPAGWHPSHKYFTFDNPSVPKWEPPQKRTALVTTPGLTSQAKNVRLVDADTCQMIDQIDEQIHQLRIKRQTLIQDKFLELPLIKEGDLQPCRIYRVFATKSEANHKES